MGNDKQGPSPSSGPGPSSSTKKDSAPLSKTPHVGKQNTKPQRSFEVIQEAAELSEHEAKRAEPVPVPVVQPKSKPPKPTHSTTLTTVHSTLIKPTRGEPNNKVMLDTALRLGLRDIEGVTDYEDDLRRAVQAKMAASRLRVQMERKKKKDEAEERRLTATGLVGSTYNSMALSHEGKRSSDDYQQQRNRSVTDRIRKWISGSEFLFLAFSKIYYDIVANNVHAVQINHENHYNLIESFLNSVRLKIPYACQL
jgi:hypothetical protein